MKKYTLSFLVLSLLLLCSAHQPGDTWIPLFDGKTFDGWKSGEHSGTFTIDEGVLVVHGERAHLFYNGPVKNHDFKNFEFKATVMTKPGSNSGIFILTEFQQEDWPSKGFEIQVNNTHTDWRKTGSVYAIQDVKEAPAADNVWFTESIQVVGKTITVRVNDKIINQYTEPENTDKPKFRRGTFAIQGHDPNSIVYYKDILVKPLPD